MSDPQGVCCYCNPYPDCGHWCEVTDENDCIDSGGTWVGEVQGNSCEACEELCANCEKQCTSNSDCPEGYICYLGKCVPDSTNTNLSPCNRPEASSSNCEKVVHVKRPYFPDGTPDFENWGVAIWHPPCDENCDGNIYDESPTDENGEFIRQQEDFGVITFKLLNDIYNQDLEPIGKYGNACCCPLFLHVVQCSGNGGARHINLNNICVDKIPQWNPQVGEVLILRGKEGTEAEGFCGYTQYNFKEDGSQRYSDTCGEKPVYEWILSLYPRLGGCSEGTIVPSADNNGFVVNFCDLDVEVFQVPDPTWIYEQSQTQTTRICTYACENCWGIFKQCGTCQNHPDYPEGTCIQSLNCNSDKDSMLVFFTPEEPCNNPNIGNKDCMSKHTTITGKSYATNSFYWNLPACNNLAFEGEECDECNVLLYEICNSRDCENTGFDFPRYLYSYVNPVWMSRTHLKAKFGEEEGFPGGGQGAACYQVLGVYSQIDIPNGSVYHTFFSSGTDWEGEFYPTNSCNMWSPCEPGDPNSTRFDCMTFCPTHNCNIPPGQSGSTCHYCCECQGVACQPGCNNNLNDLDSPNLFPSSIETELKLDIKNIKANINVVFNEPKNLPSKTNPSKEDIELYHSMFPIMYKSNFDKQQLNNVIPIGSFADNRKNVPQVNEANLIGHYEEDGVAWSAWLTIGTCNAVNSLTNNNRLFSFEYIVFAYCQSNACEIDSKVLEKKLVEFTLEGSYEN
ncbi:MAG: hypothetical protein Unbinned97contig1000_16 [Prokaryotic dsDNA virus sp.]|nr:MAG: hypothetical protein Unbinned97contig1000_16 [Prokaryotic dsDNA virus sp.]|tara:strand:- start:20387 stop:22588 length:2202 start_codon:yes stop_codon:yes gene_type:complete